FYLSLPLRADRQTTHTNYISKIAYRLVATVVVCCSPKASPKWSSTLLLLSVPSWSAIIECLSAINTATAVGLKTKICKFSFVYLLTLFKDLLSIVAGLHKYLQKETIDLPQALAYKDAVCDSLKQNRSDSTAADMYARAKALCEVNHIIIEEKLSGQRQKTKRMDDFVVESACGAHRGISTDAEQLKTKLLYPCLDRMVTELENRFSAVNATLLKGIQACSPTSENFLSDPHLADLAHHYNIDLMTEKVMVARHFLTRKKQAGAAPQDMISVYNLLDYDMFPSLKSVIQFALTVPVSSCTCERSFSALRRLHTWLRRTMGPCRLHQLAVMAIEKDVVERFGMIVSKAELKSTNRILT
uniref:HAT C-terminal dimerisation domain-containing protein n=1 Tax=Sinocyclocheilus rhinocerous TaxID=307959 RepID=A0A673JXP1_9TELE